MRVLKFVFSSFIAVSATSLLFVASMLMLLLSAFEFMVDILFPSGCLCMDIIYIHV